MQYLLGLIALLGLGFLFKSKQASTAEALLDNQKAKEGLNKVDQIISKNTDLLEAEDQKRKEITNVSSQELIDFVNNLKSDK